MISEYDIQKLTIFFEQRGFVIEDEDPNSFREDQVYLISKRLITFNFTTQLYSYEGEDSIYIHFIISNTDYFYHENQYSSATYSNADNLIASFENDFNNFKNYSFKYIRDIYEELKTFTGKNLSVKKEEIIKIIDTNDLDI